MNKQQEVFVEDLQPVTRALKEAYNIARDLGIEDQAFSKSVNDILLANFLGHQLSPGGQGSDAQDIHGNYEYKCSVTEKFNFHMGSNKGQEANLSLMRKKFDGIKAVFCAKLVNGKIDGVAKLSQEVFIHHFSDFIKNRLTGGQFIWTIKWDSLICLSGVEIVSRGAIRNSYSRLADKLVEILELCKSVGLSEKIFSKGEHNHILLADRLGHNLSFQRHGPDAYDSEKNGYEYKITVGDNFNFHFGARKTKEENEALIVKKCRDISGAFCAVRKYEEFTKIFYIPSKELEKILLETLLSSTGKQLIKNFKPYQLSNRGFQINLQ